MNDCCVEQLNEMHEVADYFWWFQRFIAASPFILLIPDMDPTVGTKDLIATTAEKASVMTFEVANSRIHKNKTLPDFADAVRALGRISAGELAQLASSHGASHALPLRDAKIKNFWMNMSAAYVQALLGK
jgi:hypothetical protein